MLTQEEFGKKLKDFRKQNNLTQRELAQKIDVGQASISKWEEGEKDPGVSNILRLCEAFQVTLDEFLGVEKKNERITLRQTPTLTVQIEQAELERVLDYLLTTGERRVEVTLLIDKT